MSAAVDKAVRAFDQAGASSRPVILPERLANADAAHATIMAYEAARALWHERNAHEAELSDDLTAFLDAGRAIEDDAYRRARESVAVAKTRLHDLFGEIDVLATPSAAGAAPEGLSHTGSSEYNRLWTALGVPAVNVPGLADETGMPLGVQLIGPAGTDGLVLAAGAVLEDAFKRGSGPA